MRNEMINIGDKSPFFLCMRKKDESFDENQATKMYVRMKIMHECKENKEDLIMMTKMTMIEDMIEE